jgi:hypothetical protein
MCAIGNLGLINIIIAINPQIHNLDFKHLKAPKLI